MTVSRVYRICNAYESGYGHGARDDGLDSSRTPFAEPELAEAYQIGYEAGRGGNAKLFDEVYAELRRATEKFPTWPNDPLHALAVLGEEFGELTKAMLQHIYEPYKGVTASDIRCEAIQTATMAIRLAMSLDRYDYLKAGQHEQIEVTAAASDPEMLGL